MENDFVDLEELFKSAFEDTGKGLPSREAAPSMDKVCTSV